MEIVISAMWNIWRCRNDSIFKTLTPSLARWKVLAQADILLHQRRVKTIVVPSFLDWVLNSLTYMADSFIFQPP